MTKAELLQQMREARAGLDAIVERIPDEQMEHPPIVGHWPAKIVVAHIMSFERWTAAQIRAGLRGTSATARERYDTDDIPDDIEGSDQEAFNAAIERLYDDWPIAKVRGSAQRAYADLVAAVESLSDADLFDPDRFDWCAGMALSDITPRQSWQHYALHLPALRTLTEDKEGGT